MGYVIVAPQPYTLILPNSEEDITGAAETTNWLSNNLQPLLPTGVEPNLLNLALAGHRRGGHFSLALSHAQTAPNFSALIGVDPVVGTSKTAQTPPQILTYKPSSFELGFPAVVIGPGLGSQKKNFLFPACAPDGVSHNEFYRECQAPCYHFVISDFGHVDMVYDNAPKIFRCACKNGDGNCRDLMRRSIAGTVVTFLRGCFEDQKGDLRVILADPQSAPAKLDPVSCRGS
ncbi:uncharacterized protein A4U43_C07F21200 [Asparagus officinalis]|uniref:Uncharacterized protein n=1 Tax=Asparagus officinalis TaxID=4686 RepID=A0A5P1EDT7_ASPOF|nr:uncharacterized protein A4U43_C07F21200 [Asparagus officinalis]